MELVLYSEESCLFFLSRQSAVQFELSMSLALVMTFTTMQIQVFFYNKIYSPSKLLNYTFLPRNNVYVSLLTIVRFLFAFRPVAHM